MWFQFQMASISISRFDGTHRCETTFTQIRLEERQKIVCGSSRNFWEVTLAVNPETGLGCCFKLIFQCTITRKIRKRILFISGKSHQEKNV